MNKVKAMAGVAKQDTESFLKALAIVILKMRDKKVKPLLPAFKAILPTAKKVVSAFKLDKEAFSVLTNRILGRPSEVRDLASTFVTSLREGLKSRIKQDTESVSLGQLDVLNAVTTLLSKPDSESAYSRLSLFVTKLNDRELNKYYTKTEKESGGSFTALFAKLEVLAKKLGAKTPYLTMEEKSKVKNPNALKDYNALRKSITDRFKHDIRSVVGEAASGKSFMLMPEFTATMEAKGYPHDFLVSRYSTVLMKSKLIGIMEDGNLTNKSGKPLSSATGAPVTGVGPGMKVEVNKNHDATLSKENRQAWVFSMLGGGSAPNRAYLLDMVRFRKGATNDKLEKVDAAEVEKWKKKWRGDTKHLGLSMLAEALYWTAGRYGSGIGSAAGERTYGMSWISGKDGAAAKVLNLSGNRVKITYPGKKGITQTHMLEPSMAQTPTDKKALLALIAYVRKARDAKREFVFLASKGKGRVAPAEFNTWFSSITGVTAHKIRHIRGTQLAIQALEIATNALKKKKTKSEKVVNDAFMDAMKVVGLQLGHVSKDKVTPNTAIKHYVLPKVMNDWYKEQGQRPPTAVSKAIESSGKE